MLTSSLLLLLLLMCPGDVRTEITASDIREAAENSRRLAAELTVILKRVRSGEAEGDIVKNLRSKIQSLEEELDTDSREEKARRTEDKARKIRTAEFRQMLRKFYLGSHYNFSV